MKIIIFLQFLGNFLLNIECVILHIITFRAGAKRVNLPQLSVNGAQLEILRIVGTFITLPFHGIK